MRDTSIDMRLYALERGSPGARAVMGQAAGVRQAGQSALVNAGAVGLGALTGFVVANALGPSGPSTAGRDLFAATLGAMGGGLVATWLQGGQAPERRPRFRPLVRRR